MHRIAVIMASAIALSGLMACGVNADTVKTTDNEKTVVSFNDGKIPGNFLRDSATADIENWNGRKTLCVHFDRKEWPKINFIAPDGGWDWSQYGGIAVDVYNPSDTPVMLSIRIDNPGADGVNNCNGRTETIPPKVWTKFETFFPSNDRDIFWGMRGLPLRAAECNSRIILDLKNIAAFQFFLPLPEKPATLYFDNIRLFGTNQPLDQIVKMPFVDKFGQFKLSDWPGKLKDENEFAQRKEKEESDLAKRPELAERDKFGGWSTGPKMDATGWFRTARVNGKWWLVTPEGHLFLSVGFNVVGIWERTFTEKREKWFEWLPEENSEFGSIYGRQSKSWPNVDIVNGQTYSFYCANLIRKYGSDWKNQWRKTTRARMHSWGFNTITTWADEELRQQSGIPFIVYIQTRGEFKRVQNSGMPDPFDPKFAIEADKCIADGVNGFSLNPLCIGYFVNNEMSWDGAMARCILAGPLDSPCRIAMIDWLKSKYPTIKDLQKAWHTDVDDWDKLKGSNESAESQHDSDEFAYIFAKKYFDIIHASLQKHAPHQLDMGCRFSVVSNPVLNACADTVDVVSLNMYQTSIGRDRWVGKNDLKKPIIVSEFHFGALDRGLFHTGLVGARNQQERAEDYVRYVNSVADCPSFVGCHWFQYIDEAITGRDIDGENYNIGFVDVTDTPYPELLKSAIKANSDMYSRHWRSK